MPCLHPDFTRVILPNYDISSKLSAATKDLSTTSWIEGHCVWLCGCVVCNDQCIFHVIWRCGVQFGTHSLGINTHLNLIGIFRLRSMVSWQWHWQWFLFVGSHGNQKYCQRYWIWRDLKMRLSSAAAEWGYLYYIGHVGHDLYSPFPCFPWY